MLYKIPMKPMTDLHDKEKKKDDGRFDLLVCDHKGCGHQKQIHSENGCESIFFTADGDYWCNCKKFKNNLMKFL